MLLCPLGISHHVFICHHCLTLQGLLQWHLGINSAAPGGTQDRRFTPNAHGYDSYLGAPWTNSPMCAMDSDGVSNLIATGPAFCFLMANNTVVEQPLRIENFTGTITDHAVTFISRQTAAHPWFFLMAYFHVHTPLFTSRENRGRSDGGSFGDNIEELDDSVGVVMSAVRQFGFHNNTLVFLTSDNGPYQEEGWAKSGRTNVYDKSRRRIGRLRGGKGQLFEGGVRMPGAVVWPGVIRAGAVSDTLVSTLDIFPTVLSAAGVNPPDGYAIDGKDMGVVLRGASKRSQHEVFLHYCGFNILAARVWGRWKVWWAMQNWYTNDPPNSSVCVECCNGINPYSRLTGATATQLCGCQEGAGSKDIRSLAAPVVFDMQTDLLELHAINSDAAWPKGANASYTEVVAVAARAKADMESSVRPHIRISVYDYEYNVCTGYRSVVLSCCTMPCQGDA
jgi:hypothetical protein